MEVKLKYKVLVKNWKFEKERKTWVKVSVCGCKLRERRGRGRLLNFLKPIMPCGGMSERRHVSHIQRYSYDPLSFNYLFIYMQLLKMVHCQPHTPNESFGKRKLNNKYIYIYIFLVSNLMSLEIKSVP